MKYTAVFVCQAGFIEMQSLFLAASLRESLQGDFKIIAAVPKNFGNIDNVTKEFFKTINVDIIEFHNEFNPAYPLGNKIYAVNLTQTEFTLFIDSDSVCVKSFNPSSFPECEVFCCTEDPFLSYSIEEWENFQKLLHVEVPMHTLKQSMNTPLLWIKASTEIAKNWMLFAKTIHKAVYYENFSMRRKRKIDNIAFTMANYATQTNCCVSDPLTWNGDPQWWSYSRCTCHDWEKMIHVKERVFNPYMCLPDHVFYYDDNVLKSLGLPYFLNLANGSGYCEVHQGKTNIKRRQVGLSHYPFVRSFLYSILSKYPIIDQHPQFNNYIQRYIQNNDTAWFMKPASYVRKPYF